MIFYIFCDTLYANCETVTIKSRKLKMSDSLPLCSFYLLSYNQSNFIEEALHGAFSQDYPNLEIIISDDNSTDDTWEKIQNFVKSHSTGHKIIMNRNQKNMGICGHINHVISLAHGEYIIASAGDDISLPQRTSNCVKEFLANPSATLVHSNFQTVDESGKIISSGRKEGRKEGRTEGRKEGRKSYRLFDGIPEKYI